MSDENKIEAVVSIIDAATPTIDNITRSLGKMKDDVGGIVGEITGKFEQLSDSVGLFGKALGGLSIAAVVGSLAEMVAKTAETGAGLYKTSQEIGISVEALSRLKKSVELAHGSYEGFVTAMGKFSKGLHTSTEDSGDFDRALKALGLNLNDLKNMKSEDALLKVAEKMAELKDGSAKTAISMLLFGKSGKEMIPVLNELREHLESVKASMGDSGAKSASQFEQSLIRLKQSASDLAITIGGPLIEVLNKLFAMMGKSDKISNLKEDLAGINEKIKDYEGVLTKSQGMFGFLVPDGAVENAKQKLQKLHDQRLELWQQISAEEKKDSGKSTKDAKIPDKPQKAEKEPKSRMGDWEAQLTAIKAGVTQEEEIYGRHWEMSKEEEEKSPRCLASKDPPFFWALCIVTILITAPSV